MCLGNNFIASEGSFFFPLFASFGFFVLFCSVFCHVSFEDPTKITASCHLAWPCPGLGENGGEWIQKAWWCRVSDEMSLCLPTRAAGLSQQKPGRTILPVHSWRNRHGFSPPNNEPRNVLHLPPEKELPMARTRARWFGER